MDNFQGSPLSTRLLKFFHGLISITFYYFSCLLQWSQESTFWPAGREKWNLYFFHKILQILMEAKMDPTSVLYVCFKSNTPGYQYHLSTLLSWKLSILWPATKLPRKPLFLHHKVYQRIVRYLVFIK